MVVVHVCMYMVAVLACVYVVYRQQASWIYNKTTLMCNTDTFTYHKTTVDMQKQYYFLS